MEKMTSDELTTLLKASPEVYDDVIKKDQEKFESLREEFAGYREKQKQGLYGQEYEAKKDIQGNCYLYGVDVDHAKRADMDGLYEMDSRYNDFGPILFRELGYTFEIPEKDIKNMTPAEYANFMGPIWEISQKYETRADDLEDIRTVITILSAFSMYVGVEGVASAVALDTADTAVSIISGHRAGTILGIFSITLPALMDDAAKGGKLAAKDLSNGIEGLSEAERVKLYKELEVEGITDIRKLDVDQDVLKIYSKETTYEIRMMDGVVEGKGNFESRFGDVLATNGITIEEFDFLKLKDISTLTDTEKAMLKNIRESVPFPNSDTVLQKVIPSSDIEKYLNGTYTEVGEYVTRAEDVTHLKTYDDIFDRLRLDYPNTQFKPDIEESIGVIRYTTDEVSEISIPYGVDMGGTEVAAQPFTGNGFTKSTNGQIIPEFKCDSYLEVVDRAQLFEVSKDGNETLKAVYSELLGKFIPVN